MLDGKAQRETGRSALYQIYPRSFADSDGDGISDINGIREAPYLAELGVDAIWISPGTRRRCSTAATTSPTTAASTPTSAPWLTRTRSSQKPTPSGFGCSSIWSPTTARGSTLVQGGPRRRTGSPERDLFWFREGLGARTARPPTNGWAAFGGAAWGDVDDGQWYLHLFDISQPDFNWENPEVSEEFDAILRFWFDRGVDGFRIDVAHSMAKDDTLPTVRPANRVTRRTRSGASALGPADGGTTSTAAGG